MEHQVKSKRVELTETLLKDYIKKQKAFSQEQRQLLYHIAQNCIKSNALLLKFYTVLQKKSGEFQEEGGKFLWKMDGENGMLSYGEKKVVFSTNALKRAVGDLMELTENVLPLGSLVQLRKEEFREVFDVNKVEQIRVIITHRFIRQEELSYFTYGGVVYPVANFNGNQIIKFTPSLIEKVVHRGYRDEQEDTYVYLMKQEFLIEKGIHLVGLENQEVEHES